MEDGRDGGEDGVGSCKRDACTTFGGAEGLGGLGGEWESEGEGRLLALRFTLRAACGWLPPFGRFAER
jgi:hypothetical protein